MTDETSEQPTVDGPAVESLEQQLCSRSKPTATRPTPSWPTWR